MSANDKKRSYAIMAHDQEHHNKSAGANDNDNQTYHTEDREPTVTTTNNDMAIHDHVAATTAGKPQDGEAKDGEVKGVDQVNVEGDSVASVSDGGDTAVAQDGGDKSGEEADEISAVGDDEASASEDGEEQEEEAGEDEEMYEEEDEDEDEEEEDEDEDPNHVADWGVLLWRHAAAIEDDGDIPRRLRRGPPLSSAAPTIRRRGDRDGEGEAIENEAEEKGEDEEKGENKDDDKDDHKDGPNEHEDEGVNEEEEQKDNESL